MAKKSPQARSLISIEKDLIIPKQTSAPQKYRVELEKIAPRSLKESWEKLDHCFYGVSLQSPHVEEHKLSAISLWLNKHFKRVTVLVGDSLHRLTLQVREGLKEKESRQKAHDLTQAFLNNHGHHFKSTSQCHFQFAFCSEIQFFLDYWKNYKTIEHLYSEGKAFSRAVDECAETFVGRKIQGDNEIYVPGQKFSLIKLSRQYLLEEMAIFSCMVQKDWPTMVYPGWLSIFTEIAEGLHPELPKDLKKLTCIALRLKKKKHIS